MCWMTVHRGRNAAKRAADAIRAHESSGGGHAWGITAVIDDELVTVKDGGMIPDEPIAPKSRFALAHTRFSTRGDATDPRNAHPFEIEKDDEVVATLAHNGTWYEAPTHEWKSDTYMMASLLEAKVQTQSLDEAVQSLADTTGETFIVMTTDRAYIHSGRFDITLDAVNGAVASSGYTPIPTGDIITFEHKQATLL